MLILEYKVKAKPEQTAAIDEAIRTGQFIQNKCLRYWMDNKKVGKYDLNKYCKVLAKEFSFASELNSMARQAHAERAWSSISRFYDNCKKGVNPVGYPRFKKFTRSVEYKTSGWKLFDTKRIEFTDKKNIGELRLVGTHDLGFYSDDLIKRVRLVRRADGYYCQFCIAVDRSESLEPTGNTVGLDVGLESFYTDSNGHKEANPRFYRIVEKRRKRLQRRLSKKKKGSNNRAKARNQLARFDLKISRQRKDHAVKLARCVIFTNDVVAYEDLKIRNMTKNHCLAKSITDAGWYQFRQWLEYYGRVHNRITIAVNPAYTSQQCSSCGAVVKKSLSTRTHICACGCVLDRDENAALNILASGVSTVGHTGRSLLDRVNASGDVTALGPGVTLAQKVAS
ncbi:MAG: transposase [Cyanobacteria bacterium P01_H01_bin.26]